MSAARLARAAAAVAILSLTVGACAAKTSTSTGGSSSGNGPVNLPVVSTLPVPSDAADPAGDGKAKCSGVTIGYVGAESGGNAQLGINIYTGVQLAINKHNQANPSCQVGYKKYDTGGTPTQAPGVVTQVVHSPDIIGVVGLPFSGESKATGATFQQNGLVHVSPSATNPGLTTNGWTTFFRAVGNDNSQGPAAAKFMTDQLKAKRVCVVQDDSDYGIGVAKTTLATLGSVADPACGDKVVTNQKDFSSTVSKIMAVKPDAVFYAGYYAEGAPFDQQLVNKGYTGAWVGPDGTKDQAFVEQAGSASSNAYFVCPCIDGSLIPSFVDAYKTVSNGAVPGTYSVEGYDAATVLLKGIDAGNTTRAKLLNYVKNYNGDGYSKHLQWDATGELTTSAVYGYKVQGGKIVFVGKIS